MGARSKIKYWQRKFYQLFAGSMENSRMDTMTILHKLNCTPQFTLDGLIYLTVAGSNAYGTVVKDTDVDIIGIYIPPRENLYPQEFSYIQGYSEPQRVENVYQIHHQFIGDQEYDINVFNIIHFFNLAKRGNPNIIDAINTDAQFHLYKSHIGRLIHTNRHMFYSKSMYPRFCGMIKNHMDTIMTKKNTGGRAGLVEKFGYDTKDAGHTLRVQHALLDILTDGKYGLQTYKDFIKDVRLGKFSLAEINEMFLENECKMKELIKTTKLRETVDEGHIHATLQLCLDMFYGD